MESGTEKRWLLPAFIALAVLCLFLASSKLGGPAGAKAQLQAEAEDKIVVIPVQIERDSYGLAMVDTVGKTVWIYELNSRGPAHSRLRLLAARSWRYDSMLQQYNTAEPMPEQIKMLLENMRKRSNVRQQNQNIDILEMAKPGNDNSGKE